jgi:hypothetical protein
VRDEFSKSEKYFDLKRLWHRRIMIDTNSMCLRRQAVLDIGGWDEKLGFWEDWELTLRLSEKHPNGFVYLNRTLLDYQQKINLKMRKMFLNFGKMKKLKYLINIKIIQN